MDADDFEDTNLNKDQWKGEDEDDVMENWDDDSEEEKEKGLWSKLSL